MDDKARVTYVTFALAALADAEHAEREVYARARAAHLAPDHRRFADLREEAQTLRSIADRVAQYLGYVTAADLRNARRVEHEG